MVVRPLLLRPPLLFLPSVSALIGAPLCKPARSISTNPRWLGVVGLYFFSAITCPLQTRRHIDAVTFFEGHHGTLHRRLPADGALECLHLALADDGVDAFDLDVEQLFDGGLDLRLGRG